MGSVHNKITSVKYHNLFDFQLTKEELHRWQYKNIREKTRGVKNKSRLKREKYSKEKKKIAQKAAKIISKIPTVCFIGITGSLAMNNADKNSDIDLMIITKKNSLWTTRPFVYGLLKIFGFKLRSPNRKEIENALCLNMWFDENDILWDKNDRNLYTAHEIAQIVPLFNKNNIYEKLLFKNRWILNYWPNSVKIKSNDLDSFKTKKLAQKKTKISPKLILDWVISVIEKIFFNFQYFYMQNKITREQVTLTRAVFHPKDWGKIIFKKLSS